jgi:hypothetical protein
MDIPEAKVPKVRKIATLMANEAVAVGVVESLHCSLFCHLDAGVPFNRFTLESSEVPKGRLLACWETAAQPIRSNALILVRSVRNIRKPESNCRPQCVMNWLVLTFRAI